MSVERGPARWGAVAVIPGRVVAGGQLVKLHPNCRIATLISRDEVATSAEGMYGSLRHLVKPILEKISVATRTWTASLKPTNSSFVPTSLKTWYPRSLLLTPRHGSAFRDTGGTPIGSSPGDLGCPRRRISHSNLAEYGETPSVMTQSDAHPTADSEGAKGRLEERPKLLYRDRTQSPSTSALTSRKAGSFLTSRLPLRTDQCKNRLDDRRRQGEGKGTRRQPGILEPPLDHPAHVLRGQRLAGQPLRLAPKIAAKPEPGTK